MALSIRFNEEKNQLLLATRRICFDDVILAIKNGDLLAENEHPNPKFQHQRIFVVKIGAYAYVVPYVLDERRNELFLKTVYPSRVLTKKYLKGEQNEK